MLIRKFRSVYRALQLLAMGIVFACGCQASSLTCAVSDQYGNVVSDSCSGPLPDGVAFNFGGTATDVKLGTISAGEDFGVTPCSDEFCAESYAQYEFTPTDAALAGHYTVNYSYSVTLNAWFALLGSSGPGYVEADVMDVDYKGPFGEQGGGQIRILGGISDSGSCGETGCRDVLFGPFFFGEPFEVTATASLSGTARESDTVGGGGGQGAYIDAIGIVDSSGSPIAGAYLAQLPEPASSLMVMAALALMLCLGKFGRGPCGSGLIKKLACKQDSNAGLI